MKHCRQCGRPFEPKAAYHQLCDACYLAQRRRSHTGRLWTGIAHPEIALGVMVMGAVIVVLLRGCER